MPRINNTVVYVHELYPHYSGDTMECDFTVTINELRSLQNVDASNVDNQEALQSCLEARAGSSVFFSTDLLHEREQMLKIIKRLVSKKRTTLMTEEGYYGFSTKSFTDARQAAFRMEAIANSEYDHWA